MGKTIAVPEEVIQAGLPNSVLKLYLLLLESINPEGAVILKNREIISILGFSEKKIQRGLATLTSKNLIKVSMYKNYYRTIHPLYIPTT